MHNLMCYYSCLVFDFSWFCITSWKSFSTSLDRHVYCNLPWPTFLYLLPSNMQYYLYCCLLAMLGVIVFIRTCFLLKTLLLTLAVVVYLALFLHIYAPRAECLISMLYNSTKWVVVVVLCEWKLWLKVIKMKQQRVRLWKEKSNEQKKQAFLSFFATFYTLNN